MLSNSYPMLQFNLGDEINMMRDSLRRFVDTELAPRADEIDRTDTFPRDLWPRWETWGCTGSRFRKNMAVWAGLSGAGHCRRRAEPRLGLCWPVIWRAFQFVREPDFPLGQ